MKISKSCKILFIQNLHIYSFSSTTVYDDIYTGVLFSPAVYQGGRGDGAGGTGSSCGLSSPAEPRLAPGGGHPRGLQLRQRVSLTLCDMDTIHYICLPDQYSVNLYSLMVKADLTAPVTNTDTSVLS